MTQDELQTLFEKHYTELYVFAMRIIGAREAHDVVMDVYIRVFENSKVDVNIGAIRTYLYLSVKNKCTDVLRKRALIDMNNAIPEDDCDGILDDTNIQEDTENKQILIQIIGIINLLPPQQKTVVELSFIGQASREEIAKIMDLSENTVRNHKRVAMKVIKSKIDNLV